MKNLLQRTKMLDEARQGIAKPNASPEENARPKGHNFIVEILIFLAVFVVCQIAASIPVSPAVMSSFLSSEKCMSYMMAYVV